MLKILKRLVTTRGSYHLLDISNRLLFLAKVVKRKSGTGSGAVTLFGLIKNENIILFGGTEYSNEHTTEEWKILTGITKLLTYYVNCTFGSNVMVDAIVGHHCRFCSVLMVQQYSL